MNIFLANVGNRDLAYNLSALFYVCFEKKCEYWEDIKKELELCGIGMRIATQKINTNYEHYKDKLVAPILSPSIDFVFTQVEKIDSVVLFVTDNPQEDQKNWIWDTIETGKLLEKILRSNDDLSRKIKSIKIVKAEVENPNDYDAAYIFISNKLNALFKGKVDNIFTAISGGIPAMNSALRSYTIERFGIKTHLIQKDEPFEREKEAGIHGQAKKINSWTFRKTIISRLVENLLQRYDYEGILELLKSESINDVLLDKLCAHGKARLNFDFNGAKAILAGIKSTNQPLINLKNSVSNPSYLQRAAEIAFIAQILLSRGDFSGFLTRTASFRELVVNIIADTGGISFPKGFVSFAKKLEQIEKTANAMPYSNKNNKIHSTLQKISQKSVLTALCELRNDNIHSFRGINISDIEKVLPNCKKEFLLLASEIIDDLLELKDLFSKTTRINETSGIYNNLNQMIIHALNNYKE